MKLSVQFIALVILCCCTLNVVVGKVIWDSNQVIQNTTVIDDLLIQGGVNVTLSAGATLTVRTRIVINGTVSNPVNIIQEKEASDFIIDSISEDSKISNAVFVTTSVATRNSWLYVELRGNATKETTVWIQNSKFVRGSGIRVTPGDTNIGRYKLKVVNNNFEDVSGALKVFSGISDFAVEFKYNVIEEKLFNNTNWPTLFAFTCKNYDNGPKELVVDSNDITLVSGVSQYVMESSCLETVFTNNILTMHKASAQSGRGVFIERSRSEWYPPNTANSGAIVTGNTFHNFEYAIVITLPRALVQNNRMTNLGVQNVVRRNPIIVDLDTGIVSNNNIVGPRAFGLKVTRNTNNELAGTLDISGNVFENGEQDLHAIRFYSSSPLGTKDVTISDNTFGSTKALQLLVPPGSPILNFANNKFTESETEEEIRALIVDYLQNPAYGLAQPFPAINKNGDTITGGANPILITDATVLTAPVTLPSQAVYLNGLTITGEGEVTGGQSIIVYSKLVIGDPTTATVLQSNITVGYGCQKSGTTEGQWNNEGSIIRSITIGSNVNIKVYSQQYLLIENIKTANNGFGSIEICSPIELRYSALTNIGVRVCLYAVDGQYNIQNNVVRYSSERPAPVSAVSVLSNDVSSYNVQVAIKDNKFFNVPKSIVAGGGVVTVQSNEFVNSSTVIAIEQSERRPKDNVLSIRDNLIVGANRVLVKESDMVLSFRHIQVINNQISRSACIVPSDNVERGLISFYGTNRFDTLNIESNLFFDNKCSSDYQGFLVFKKAYSYGKKFAIDIKLNAFFDSLPAARSVNALVSSSSIIIDLDVISEGSYNITQNAFSTTGVQRHLRITGAKQGFETTTVSAVYNFWGIKTDNGTSVQAEIDSDFGSIAYEPFFLSEKVTDFSQNNIGGKQQPPTPVPSKPVASSPHTPEHSEEKKKPKKHSRKAVAIAVTLSVVGFLVIVITLAVVVVAVWWNNRKSDTSLLKTPLTDSNSLEAREQ